MNQREIRNARFHYLAQPPADPFPGQYYWDTGLNQLRVYLAHGWESVGAGRWTGSRQLQHGVSQEIEHGLETEYLNLTATVKTEIEGQTVKVPAALEWWIIDANNVGIKASGGNFPNETFYITIS